MRKLKQGFTLIELMFVVVIIGILATLAVPQYNLYQKRIRFVEVTHQASSFKQGVESCLTYETRGDLTACDASTNGIKANVDAPSAYVKYVGVENGTIVGNATTRGGLDEEKIFLTPSYNETAGVSWTITGNCTDAALC